MPAKKSALRILALAIAALSVAPLALAHSPGEHVHDGHGAMAPAAADHSMHSMHAMPAAQPPAVEIVPVKLSGKPLSDQDGRSVRLKNDVIGDRIAVVTFVYTSCTTVCPVVSAIMSDLQAKLGARLNTDVRIVSLSVDPAHDSPAQLKTYSALYDAKPGWFWLTGSSANVTEALKGFGAYTADYQNHPVIVMIGDGKTGKWSRHYGLSPSDKLLARIDEYLAARKPATLARAD